MRAGPRNGSSAIISAVRQNFELKLGLWVHRVILSEKQWESGVVPICLDTAFEAGKDARLSKADIPFCHADRFFLYDERSLPNY